MCKEKGVDPWIEIDGGASGKNAKEIKEAGDGCWALLMGSSLMHIAILMDLPSKLVHWYALVLGC